MSPVVPPRRLLFLPGPTQVEPRVYQAMTQPIVSNTDPYLFEIFAAVRRDLRTCFGTSNVNTYVIPGTGSSGMETALSNFTAPGDKLAVFVAGFFGQRIVEMARRHGSNVVTFEKPWGDNFTESEARAFLDRERPNVAAFVHGETSTGVLQPPEAIARPAHDVGALVIADCVTTLGTVPIHVDESGIDIAFSCSQKGLSCPPGLAPITVSDAAWQRMLARKIDNPIWYLDLKRIGAYFEQKAYHHTAPVSMYYALHEGLAAIHDEGVEQRFARHAAAHASFVRRVTSLGLEMFVAPGKRLPTLNTVRVPNGVDEAAIRKRLIQEFGIEIASGIGKLSGQIFRIGVMGPLANDASLERFFGAFAACLAVPVPA